MNSGLIRSKALTYSSFWNLGVSYINVPTNIKPGEVLVHVRAVSVNPFDIMMHKLSLFFIGSFKKVTGCDFAGEVVKAGENAPFKEGDSIYGCRLAPMSINGTYSEYIIVDPKKCIFCDKIPEGMIYEQAASIPCVSATAYGALKMGINRICPTIKDDLEGSLKGKNILVIGAGTSVGSYAVEMAKKYMDAKAVVVTCGTRSEQRLRDAGADLALDYHDGDLKNVNEILKYVKDHGKFDMVLDCVRNEVYYDYADIILKAPSDNGAFVQLYGSNSMNLFNCSLSSIIFPSFKSIKYKLMHLLGVYKSPLYVYKLAYDSTFGSVIDTMWRKKLLDTPIDSIFRGWSQYDLALHKVATANISGKVVCIL